MLVPQAERAVCVAKSSAKAPLTSTSVTPRRRVAEARLGVGIGGLKEECIQQRPYREIPLAAMEREDENGQRPAARRCRARTTT